MKIRFLFSFYVYILDHFSGNWNCLVGGGGWFVCFGWGFEAIVRFVSKIVITSYCVFVFHDNVKCEMCTNFFVLF